MTLTTSTARSRGRRAIAALAILNVVIALLPPIHWAVSGDPAVGIGYFVGSGLLFVVSIALIAWIDARIDSAEVQ